MDAKKFLRELQRMCKASSCSECPFKGRNCNYPDIDDDTDKAVDAVEEWSKEHPLLTNADKFKGVFGLQIIATTNYNCRIYQDSEPISIAVNKWLSQEYKEVQHDA